MKYGSRSIVLDRIYMKLLEKFARAVLHGLNRVRVNAIINSHLVEPAVLGLSDRSPASGVSQR